MTGPLFYETKSHMIFTPSHELDDFYTGCVHSLLLNLFGWFSATFVSFIAVFECFNAS